MKQLLLLIVLILTISTANAARFFVIDGDKPVLGQMQSSTAGYDNGFTINFGDNKSYPFLYNHGGDFSVKDYGLHEAGIEAVFVDRVVNTGEWYYSIQAFNDDGAVHIKYTEWDFEGVHYLGLGFEDLNINSTEYDGDFNDFQIVLTNITSFTSPVPEPSHVAMLFVGLLILLASGTRKKYDNKTV